MTPQVYHLKPLAPATFLGWQYAVGYPPLSLWQLTEAVGGLPAKSTVSSITLTRLGFALPNHPRPRKEVS